VYGRDRRYDCDCVHDRDQDSGGYGGQTNFPMGIIDYAHDDKKDAPSGTALELAARLSRIRPSELTIPLDQTQGIIESRGARLSESQIHSVRLPGYTISAEIIFGLPDQRLSIRHDSGTSAQPYVGGALLAIREVSSFVGLRRGLDSVLDLE